MNNTDSIYLESDHEILELIKFHEHALLLAEQSGIQDPERQQKRAIFNDFVSLVHNRAKQRMAADIDRREQEAKLMEERTHLECEKCGRVQRVNIICEERYPFSDTMNDVVECAVCEEVFFNTMPNNWEDRDKFFGVLIEKMTDGSKTDESILPESERIAAVEQMKKVRASHVQVLEAERNKAEAYQKAEQSLIDIRDMLLNAKLASLNYNNNQGMA